MTRTQTGIAIAAALFVGWVALEWHGVALLIDNAGTTCRNWAQNQHLAKLDQHPRGCVTEQEIAAATFRMTSVAYYGGYRCEWRYADGQVVYSEPEQHNGEPVASPPIRLGNAEQMLLGDVLNLAVKLKLDQQADVRPERPVCDGGEVEYEFAVGGHKGRFKIINTDPRHLEQFRYKCQRLMEWFKSSSGKMPVQSEWADSADGKLSLQLIAYAAQSDATQPVALSAYLRNNTAHSLTVLRPFEDTSPAESNRIEIVGFLGRVRFTEPTQSTASPNALATLRPGESAWGEIELTPEINESRQRYESCRVCYTYTARVPNAWTGRISSAAITIHRHDPGK